MSRIVQIESLFHQTRQLPVDTDLDSWLDTQCGGDTELRDEVASLVRAHWEQETAGAVPPEQGIPSANFGVYRAIELLGRGGMSAVYRAERTDGNFEQIVALKVMAAHLAGAEFLQRFETERRLLASLHHPNITRLLDGGVSSAGDPYLVTEYADGQSIDRYCDLHKLSIAARLRLFLQVCESVDYAHRNLIMHRDLKPANILVTTDGVVKLLDFGTASLLTVDRDITVTRMRMMTPRYASPEQLRGERVNIATDIYSLGIILYELLSGAWPFGNPHSVVSELNRATGKTQPHAPSTVITEESAASRSMPKDQLARMLKGDLSAIVLKALESTPERRYESVRLLANDVESFLAGLPVLARPQTFAYRARKFLRRHWAPLGAAAIFIIGLLTATLIAVNQSRLAQEEARKAEKVSEFLGTMLASAGDLSFEPQKFTVAQMLDRAAPLLEKSWRGDPKVEAQLRLNLAASYAAVQRNDLGRIQAEKALAISKRLGDLSGEANAFRVIGGITSQEKGAVEETERELRTALELINRVGKAARPQDVFSIKLALADYLSLMKQAEFDYALKLADEAAALARSQPDLIQGALAYALTTRGSILSATGKTAESEIALLEAANIFERENIMSQEAAQPLYLLYILYGRARNLAKAAEFAQKRYDKLTQVLGTDNVWAAGAEIMLARVLAANGETERAMRIVVAAMPVVRKGYPPGNGNLWTYLTDSAYVFNNASRFLDAESSAREALELLDLERLPEIDARRASSLYALGISQLGEHKVKDATATFERALKIYIGLGPSWAGSVETTKKKLAECCAVAPTANR